MDVRVGLLSCNTDRKDASSIRGVMVKNMKLWQSERRNVYLSLRSELGFEEQARYVDCCASEVCRLQIRIGIEEHRGM